MFTLGRHSIIGLWRTFFVLFAAAACADVPLAPATKVSPAVTARSSVVIAPSHYAMLTLPLLPGAIESWATAINDNGDIAGAMRFPGYVRAVRWSNGSVVDLGVPGGYDESEATDINNAGWVVGEVRGGGKAPRPFLLTPATGMAVISTAPGGSWANAVSDGGIVVGATNLHKAWRWSSNGGFEYLPAPSVSSEAHDVTGSGYVVGAVGTPHPSGWLSPAAHAWSPNGSGMTLGWLPGGYSAVATAISSSGWIVGYAEYSDTPDYHHAFIASIFGGMQDLGPLAPNYTAEDVSAKGRIVGRILPDFRSGAAPLAWTWKDGTFAYLTTPQSLGSRAAAVNSCGIVVGSTLHPSTQSQRAVRWMRRVCDG